MNTTRRPGDVAGVYIDDHRAVAPVVKPVVKKPTVAPGLFMVYMFPIGHMPTPSSRPARQLPPPPAEVDYAAGLRFPPHDHPESGLIQSLGATHADVPEPRDGQELAEGYDPLGGENERDWDRRFLVRAGTEERRAEYAWPPGELFPEGGCDAGEAVVLEPGAVIDRFGTPEGRVFSADATPFTQRSLPPEHLDAGYHRYRVLAPLPMWQTISAAWFGQTGGGVRYRSVYPPPTSSRWAFWRLSHERRVDHHVARDRRGARRGGVRRHRGRQRLVPAPRGAPRRGRRRHVGGLLARAGQPLRLGPLHQRAGRLPLPVRPA
ncbi:hypothetical protein GCM10018954_040570 [Kutzneria kofuensis]